MKNKNLMFAVAIFALISAGATLWFQGKQMGGMAPSMMRDEVTTLYPTGRQETIGLNAVGMMGSGVSGAPTQAVESTKMIAPDYYPQPIGGDALDTEDRSYTKNSSHQVVVKDVTAYIKQMREYILSIDGRVLSTSTNTTEKYASGYIYAKVPVAKFEEATGRVTEGVQKVMDESINASDVTGQVVGIADKLQSLQDQKALKEAELAEAKAKNSSATVTLRLQQEINRFNQQIDALQKQQQATTNEVEYASVSISAASSERYFAGSEYQPTFWEEIQNAIESLGGSGRVIARLIIWTAVYSVIWLPIMLVVKWLKRGKTAVQVQ